MGVLPCTQIYPSPAFRASKEAGKSVIGRPSCVIVHMCPAPEQSLHIQTLKPSPTRSNPGRYLAFITQLAIWLRPECPDNPPPDSG